MSESNDLSLQGGTRPKRGGDQSQKSDEKWTHLENDDDLTNGAKTCIFNPDGVFGIHKRGFGCLAWFCDVDCDVTDQRGRVGVHVDMGNFVGEAGSLNC